MEKDINEITQKYINILLRDNDIDFIEEIIITLQNYMDKIKK